MNTIDKGKAWLEKLKGTEDHQTSQTLAASGEHPPQETEQTNGEPPIEGTPLFLKQVSFSIPELEREAKQAAFAAGLPTGASELDNILAAEATAGVVGSGVAALDEDRVSDGILLDIERGVADKLAHGNKLEREAKADETAAHKAYAALPDHFSARTERIIFAMVAAITAMASIASVMLVTEGVDPAIFRPTMEKLGNSNEVIRVASRIFALGVSAAPPIIFASVILTSRGQVHWSLKIILFAFEILFSAGFGFVRASHGELSFQAWGFGIWECAVIGLHSFGMLAVGQVLKADAEKREPKQIAYAVLNDAKGRLAQCRDAIAKLEIRRRRLLENIQIRAEEAERRKLLGSYAKAATSRAYHVAVEASYNDLLHHPLADKLEALLTGTDEQNHWAAKSKRSRKKDEDKS